MTQKLHIDIETYSSVDIRSSGLYKYMESPDFEILMVAYAFDDEEIKCIDLAQGETLPERFLKGLKDPDIEKWAHNAAFERNAFNSIGLKTNFKDWKCTAIKSAFCGMPLGLAQVTKTLDLKEKGKLTTGKALIKYFCVPIKPTKTNGMRSRNLPEHDMEKWEEFKVYCINDVEAEREIDHVLEQYEIPQDEWDFYWMDQEINARGILLDKSFAENAILIDDQFSKELRSDMIQLTGLENPNSPAQLKSWLSEASGKDINSLAKENVIDLIKTESGVVKELLEMRLKGSKTSTKKYVSMINTVNDDGRIRGLFQFYGANRTGRWAGRLVQMQNLPQNHLDDIDADRAMVSKGEYDMINLVHGNVPDILSQLIRTAFIAPPGKTFAVSDFSAIEARVIAWLAGEKWRMDVFATHGKIYEASASAMFNVPLDEITKGSPLRQKGKVAELALGYQGSIGAMVNMGGEKMGLTESEMKEIVKQWRKASPKIVDLWNDMERCAIKAVKLRKVVTSQFKGIQFEGSREYLTLRLPSGRKIYYRSPKVEAGKFGKDVVKYLNISDKGIWMYTDTYGGKLVENIVQAISRDLLAYSMIRLKEHDFDMVLHVHDEVVAEVPLDSGEKSLNCMIKIMEEDVPWAKGLRLTADGYITEFYKKD